jgi:hypothetical protein
LDYNEYGKKAQLKRGLSQRLVEAMITMEEPGSFTDLATLCLKLDTRIRAAEGYT